MPSTSGSPVAVGRAGTGRMDQLAAPSRIGPYVAVARVGAGGMGEVWSGYDPRLDRQVALKQIRPDHAGDPIWRQRLRNEARAVARLGHPSIVQIYDLLEQPEGDWIVLEYVEGRSLARLLDEGPLPHALLLTLARDVTAALAEAHRKGILHRDLKAENVMVTPEGRAKVLDFGLAKGSAPSGVEQALSGEGSLLGTLRAMSPEQASGLELDARSDLFSLGTLLYEMATATSPFAAATSAVTLTRICTFRPASLCERAPGMSAELSALVDRLLAKERDARPRSADEVGAELARIAERGDEEEAWSPSRTPGAPGALETLAPGGGAAKRGARRRAGWRRLAAIAGVLSAAAVAAAAYPGWRAPARGGLRYVAVPMPELALAASGGDAALLAAGVRAALLATLVGLEGVAPLVVEADAAPSSSSPASSPASSTPLPSPVSPRALARAEAADEVLTSRLDCQAQLCRVTLTRVEGRDGRVLWLDSFEIPIAEPLVAARAAAVSLQRGYPEHRARQRSLVEATRPEDYAAYLRLFLRVQRREAGADSLAMLDELGALRRRSPRFLEAYLLEAQLSSLRFFDSREPADLERALQRAAEARALAPEDPRPLVALLDVAVPAGRLDAAEAALRALEALVPGHSQLSLRRALVLEGRGDGARALQLMRQAARQRPSWSALLDLANLEYRLGELAATRRTLAELLERFPGHMKGLTLLAQVELLAGSVEQAARLYQELVWRSPGFAEISNLGVAELLLGRHDAAAEHFRRAVGLAPRSAAALLNLADAELLRGRGEEARALYARTVTLVEEDPAPELWQNLTVKGQALAHLGRKAEALAVIRRVLADHPDNPQVACEGALVLAVTGELALAAALRDRALRGGVEPRWFSLPWFAPLGPAPAVTPASD